MQMVEAYDTIATAVVAPPHVVAAIGGKPVAVPRGQRILGIATQLRGAAAASPMAAPRRGRRSRGGTWPASGHRERPW